MSQIPNVTVNHYKGVQKLKDKRKIFKQYRYKYLFKNVAMDQLHLKIPCFQLEAELFKPREHQCKSSHVLNL